MLEKISIVVSLCISIASFIVAILSFKLKVPKLNIQILNKRYDCFFGNTLCQRGERIYQNRISGVRFRLINKSQNDITIMGILLECNKETYKLIDCTNEYWEIVEFVFPDTNGEEISDGSAIYYTNEGIALPQSIKAYDGKDIIALFNYFPICIEKKVRAKITVQSTVGIKTKRINLYKYNNEYANESQVHFSV